MGLELVAAAARAAGHEVMIIDLQVEPQENYFKLIRHWRSNVIAYSCNYPANVPEIIDLAKASKDILKQCLTIIGGHSASFTARELLDHGAGAVDCILKGEGEAAITALLDAIGNNDPKALLKVPGAITQDGEGPSPVFVNNLDDVQPARDLLRHRRKYFIGVLDPAASIEFSHSAGQDSQGAGRGKIRHISGQRQYAHW